MAIDWGQIGSNVVNNLATAVPNVATSALQALVASKLAPKIEAEKASTKAAPAPTTTTIIQQAPAANWQKYLPYAIGGAVLLGAVWYMTKGRRRAG